MVDFVMKRLVFSLAVLLLLGFSWAFNQAMAASIIGSSARITLTNMISSQWLPLPASNRGWKVMYSPSWLALNPSPSTVDGEDNSIPPVSELLIALASSVDPGHYLGRLVLKDLETDQDWEADITALIEDTTENQDVAQAIFFTNTAQDLDLNMDIRTGRTGKYFLLMEHPQLAPGLKFAYVPQGKLVLFSNYGFPVANADDLYLADDVSTLWLDLGQIPLVGLEGTLKIEVDQSTSTGLVPRQETYFNILSLSGDWMVSDTYKGDTYPEYHAIIHEGYGLFSGEWNGHPISVSYSPQGWYVVEFSDGRYEYRYEVRSISSEKMKGLWSYSGSPGTQYAFEGRKIGSFFPFSSGINGPWSFVSTETSATCPVSPGFFDGMVDIAVSGDKIVLTNGDRTLQGSINGNEVLLSGSWIDGENSFGIRSSATFNKEGNEVYGTARWTVVSGELSCEGSTVFEGQR